jgi:hypothetical protein
LRISHLPSLHVYTWVETRWGFGEIFGTCPTLPSTCGSISVHRKEATDLGPQFTRWKALTAMPPRRLNQHTKLPTFVLCLSTSPDHHKQLNNSCQIVNSTVVLSFLPPSGSLPLSFRSAASLTYSSNIVNSL